MIMVYSLAERVEIIEIYFRSQCASQTAELFNQRHQDKHVHRKYVLELVQKFRATGNVCNKKRVIENAVINEATEVAVLGQIVLDPTLSTRQMSTVSGIRRSSIQTILKRNKFHPYKIHLVQELNEDDFDRRLQFCEIMSERATNEPNFISNICFSDECTFFF